MFYPSKPLGFIPYDTPDHQADSHKDVAESSPLLPTENVARLTNANWLVLEKRANVKHKVLDLRFS